MIVKLESEKVHLPTALWSALQQGWVERRWVEKTHDDLYRDIDTYRSIPNDELELATRLCQTADKDVVCIVWLTGKDRVDYQFYGVLPEYSSSGNINIMLDVIKGVVGEDVWNNGQSIPENG
jgi:hypothetical protein